MSISTGEINAVGRALDPSVCWSVNNIATCLLILLVCCSAAGAAPAGPRLGLPTPGMQGDPGDTAVSWVLSGSGLQWSISRTLLRWIEVTATVTRSSLYSIAGRFVLLRGLYPLVLGASVGEDSIGLLSSLHLGPVRIDASRVWGTLPWRGLTVRFSPRPILAMVVGVEERDGRIEERAGIEWHRGLWGASFLVGRSGWRVELAGVLR